MISVEYVNPFIQATMNVFNTMVFMPLKRETPYVKKDRGQTADISGTIGLAGTTNGVIAVTFREKVACKISENMLGEPHPSIDDTVKDTIGEIANMIAGGAKAIMAEKGLKFTIAIPSVIVGTDHSLSYPPNVPCMVMPFIVEELNEKFYLEVCLVTNGN